MKVYPKITGSLCAKMNRGISGQDGFNNMIPVIERNANDLLDKPRYLPIFEGWGIKQFDGQRLQVC